MSSRLSSAEKRSRLAEAIASLPPGASSVLSILDPETNLCQFPRPCDCCEIVFVQRKNWMARFCSPRCSTLWWQRQPTFRAKIYTKSSAEKAGAARKAWLSSDSPKAKAEIERIRALNPATNPEVQAKISAKLREIGHRPPIRGGNGSPPPIPQALLHSALGPAWTMEFVVKTGKRSEGLPHHYKIDIANPEMMVAIEVDGLSHSAIARQHQDQRKDSFLISAGWKVLRFSNRAILDWMASGTPTESSISGIFRQHRIPLSVSVAT